MKDKLDLKIFIIGIVAAFLIYLFSKQYEAPSVVFIFSVGVVFYQYWYLPRKHKENDKNL